MKKTFVFLVFLIETCAFLFAQTVTQGRIQDEKGNPVSYASIYIKEATRGIAANENGEFELKLAEGNYTLYFQSLGYEMQIREINLPQPSSLLIIMPEKAYEMRALTISANDENPAYRVMRLAIARAPYYRNSVKEYSSEVYLKTKINVDQIKGLAAMAVDKKQREKLRALSVVQESVNEIKFTAPERYEQNIKSVISGASVDLSDFGVKIDDIKVGMMRLNIYGTSPSLPLASGAFSNYRFEYAGDMQVENFLVSKIKVIPRRKDNNLVSGYLYIINNTWNVYSLDLTQNTSFGTVRVQQSYGDVGNGIFLPVSHNVEFNLSMMGIKGSGNFIGSVTYLSVIPNKKIETTTVQTTAVAPETTAQSSPAQTRTTQRKEKLQSEIEKITEKEAINNREMQRVARMQMQVAELAVKEELSEKGEKRSLEIPENYVFSKDSMADKQDTDYWNKMRPVPLMEAEIVTYRKYDSIVAVATGQDSVKRKKTPKVIVLGVLSGTTYRIDSTLRINFSGLLSLPALDYNTVDGYVYALSGGLTKQFKNESQFSFNLYGGWTFSREKFLWSANIGHSYNRKLRASWTVEGGMLTSDFAGEQGVGMVNAWSSLLFRVNYSTFYENNYFKLRHQIDVANGLELFTGFEWSDRHELQNNSSTSYFYRDSRQFRPNIPRNAEVAARPELLADNRAAVLDVRLSYTPERYYRMYNSRKYYVRSNYPTFSLQWKKGIKTVFQSDSDFDFLRIDLTQSISYGYFNRFNYTASAGKFFNDRRLAFADFAHFYTNEPAVSFNRNFGVPYQLLNCYNNSTDKWYVTAAASYYSPYILIKRMPFLSNMLFGENLYASYLLQPQMQHYLETGYGITLTDMLGIGVFVGFENARYRSWGFRLSLNISSVTGR